MTGHLGPHYATTITETETVTQATRTITHYLAQPTTTITDTGQGPIATMGGRNRVHTEAGLLNL